MTETRLKIIELIEPYMDKSLSEWCIYLYNNILYNTRFQETLEHNFLLEIKKWRIKILWHYDITAVLKYINKNVSIWVELDRFWVAFIISNKLNGWIDFVLNKPLHLYTDQEEKELLELLLKLKS